MRTTGNRPPVSDGHPVQRRNIRIRPTRLGAGLAVMVLLLWLVGLNYQVNLAYLAAFWLAGFIITGILLNLRQLLGLRLDAEVPHEIFAGGTARVRLTAAGNTRRRWLWFASADTLNHAARSDETAFSDGLYGSADSWRFWPLSDGLTQQEWPVPAPMRGHLRLPALHTAAAAPFGICLAEARWQWQTDAVVYPAPIPHTPPDNGGSGDTRRAPVQGDGDLAYLQAHQDGASLQHVAWKTYAKTGEMLDKRFETQPAESSRTLISYRDYPAAGKDQAAGLLCHRVLEAERSNTPYTLELPDRTIAPQKGQREMCLTALGLW